MLLKLLHVVFLVAACFYDRVYSDSASFSVTSSGIGSYDSLHGGFDLNNDLYHDVVIGAPQLKKAFVFLGSPTKFPLSSSADFELISTDVNFGWAFASGDLNNDGYDELLIGAQDIVYVYSGNSGGINTTPYLTFTPPSTGINYGLQIAVGDYDGDSDLDIAIGASNYSNNQTNEGAVFFYTNTVTGFSNTSSFIRESGYAGALLGSSLDFGDLNGDGYSDLVAGAPSYTGTVAQQGLVFLYYGSSSGPLAGNQMGNPYSPIVANFGAAVVTGDFNNDNIDDFCAGLPGTSGKGNLACYLGTATNPTYLTQSNTYGGNMNSKLGMSLANVGKANNDNFEDLLAGSVGEAHGYAGNITGPYSAPPPFFVVGTASVSFIVSAAGDFSGDGKRDILIANPGIAFIYYNITWGPQPTPSKTPTRTPSPSRTPSTSVTPSPSVTSSVTPSISVSSSVTPSVSVSSSVTPSASVSSSVTPTASVSPSITPSNSPSPSVTPTASVTPSVTPTISVTPSLSPSPSVTRTPSVTPSQTPSATSSVTPSATPSVTPTASRTPSVTPSTSASASVTPSASITPTVTPSISVSSSVTPSSSATPSSEVSSSNSNKKSTVIGTAVGVSAGGLLCFGAAGFFVIRRRKRQLDEEGHLERVLSEPSTPAFPPNYVPMHRVDSTGSGSTNNNSNSVSTLTSSDFDKRWEIDFPDIEIGKEIGCGAFGVVYKAQWRNCDCVVKQLNIERTDKKAISDFLKEAKTVRNVRNHKNVCTIFGVCLNPEYPICIVMEYVSGGSLYNLVVRDDVEFDALTVVRFAKDISSGMSHIHKESILHCDLAARNLLVEKQNDKYVVKVTDFGLSRVSESGTYNASSASVFPVRWSAPEVIEKLQVSRASDVWSFGVVMWEILEGKQPYYGLTNPEVVEHVCQKKLLLAKPSRFDYPPRLWQIMQQCWKWNAAERPSFEDLYKWFSEMESELKSTEVETTGQASLLTTANVMTSYLEDLPQTFLILVADANNNTVSEGGDNITATLNGTRASYIVSITDNCNGTYTASYDATTPDTYSLLVFLNKVQKINTTITVNSVPRPRVTSDQAFFTDLGTAIMVNFSEDTDRAGLSGNFDCSNLLIEQVFGNGSYCSWAEDAVLMVHLGCGYSVRPGSKITLRPLVVKPADGTSSATRQQFVILPPENPPVPQIIFRGPSHASKCGTLQLSAEQTLGSAGLPIQFTWQLQSDDPDVASIYNKLLKNVSSAKLNLAMDDFDSGRTYTFVVTAKNYYNKTSSASFDVHIMEEAAPTVVIQPAYITVTTGDMLKLRAEGVLGQCDGRSVSSQALTYSWTIHSDEGEFPMDSSAANSAELLILPNSLQAGRSYSFWVRGISINDSKIYAESEAQVVVTRSPLSVSIQGGNRLHTLGGADLILDASQDFPAARVSSEGISFQWSCVDATTGKACFTSSTVFQNGPTARIPSSYFTLGRYAFTLTASTEEDSASDTVVISADSRKQPQIFIQAPSDISANPFVLTTLEFPVEDAPFVKYEWEMLGADYSLVDYSDCNTTYNGVTFNCRNEPTLSVNTALLADGREYTFGVRAFDSDGNIAVATITRTKNTPPHGGCCTLSTRLGQSYQTMFRVECHNWEDEHYPLRYAFYRNSTAGMFPLNPGVTFVNYLDFTLPEMIGTLQVHVMDSKGAASVVSFNVNASNVAVTPNSLLGIGSYVLKENLKDVLEKGHSDGMLRTLFYLRDYLPALSDSNTKKKDTTGDFVAGITELLFSMKSEPNSFVDALKLDIFNEVVVAQNPLDAFLGFPNMVKPFATAGASTEDATFFMGILESLAGQVANQVSPQRFTSVVTSSLDYITRAAMVFLPPGPAQVSSGQTTISIVNTLLQQAPQSVQAGSTTVHLPPFFVQVPDENQPVFIAVTETAMSLYEWAVFSDLVRSPFVSVAVYQGGQKLGAGSLVESVTIDLSSSRVSGEAICQVWSGRWSTDSCVQVNQTEDTTTCECTVFPSVLSVRDDPAEEDSSVDIIQPDPSQAGDNEEEDNAGSGFDLDKKDAALLAFVGGVVILLLIVAIIVSKNRSQPEDPIHLLTKDLDPVRQTQDFDWSDVEPVHDYSLDNVSLEDVELENDKEFEDYSLGFSETEEDRIHEDEGPTRAPISMRLQRLGPGGILDEKKGYGSTSTHRNSFQTEYDLDSPRGKQSTKPEASTRTLRSREGQARPTNQPVAAAGRVGGRVARSSPRDSSSSMK